MHASVVSAGVIADPVDGSAGVGAVLNGGTRKLELLRDNPRATLVFKDGWDWVAVSGPVRLVGPDDGSDLGLDVPATIRSVFTRGRRDPRGLGGVRPGHGRAIAAAPSFVRGHDHVQCRRS